MVTILFALFVAVVWFLHRERPDHTPSYATIAGAWVRRLCERAEPDDEEDWPEEEEYPRESADPGPHKDPAEGWGGGVSISRDDQFQAVGYLPAPKPAPGPKSDLKPWQEYAIAARDKGYKTTQIKDMIQTSYGVSESTFFRWWGKAR